jgi:hypothetical protein
MGRSGSTWSFNVVKQLLAQTSVSVRAGYLDAVGDALAREGPVCDHLIVKTHVPDAVGLALIKQRACRTIYTYREPLGSILSTMEARGQTLEPAADAVKASLDLMRFQVEAGGVHLVWYDDIVERPQEVVQAIARYLELVLPEAAIAGVATMLSRDNVRRIIRALGTPVPPAAGSSAPWDGGNLFASHHVRAKPSDPARVFSAPQIAAIAKRLQLYVGGDAALRPEIRALGTVDNVTATDMRWPEPVAAAPMPAAPAAPVPVRPAQARPVATPPVAARRVEAVPVDAVPIEAIPIEAIPIEAPAIEAPPAEALPAEAPPVEAPALDVASAEVPAAEALPLEAPPEEALPLEAPPIEAPPIEAPPIEAPAIEAAPAEALSADLVGEPPEAPSLDQLDELPEAPRVGASRKLAESSSKLATAPTPAPYDPARDARRRALARDLLRSLGQPPTEKPKAPSGKPRAPRAGR